MEWLAYALIIAALLFYGPVSTWLEKKANREETQAEYFRAKTERLKMGGPDEDPEEFA